MIGKLLGAIISLIISLVNALLTPIDNLINTYLPSVSSAFNSISYFFTYVSNSLGWVISATGISSTAISLIVITLTFKLTVPLLVATFKLALSWYDKLKP